MARSEGAPLLLPEEAVVQTEQFVLQFLSTCGAAHTTRNGVLQVALPEWVAELLGVPRQTAFTFHTDLTSSDVQLLAPGSPLVDSMVQIAKGRGSATQLMYTSIGVHRLLDRLCASDPWTEGRVMHPVSQQIVGARVRVVARRPLYQEQLVFHFKVSYISDEPHEEIHTIAVDPIIERVVPYLPWNNAVTVDFSFLRKRKRGHEGAGRAADTSNDSDSYTTRRLYGIACRHLESLIEPTLHNLEQQAKESLEADRMRIEAYYRSAASELLSPLRHTLRRIALQKARLHLNPNQRTQEREKIDQLTESALSLEQAYREELDSLEGDRRRRLAELDERYRIRVRVELIGAARILVPRIEWTLRLAGAQARRDITVCHDILRDTIIDLVCDACDESFHTVTLTDDGELLCDDCLA